MAKQDIIMRYNLIIKKLRRQPSTFREIADYLDMESEIQGLDFRISKRTFHRTVDEIRSIYNIDIKFDRPGMRYFIHTDENSMVSERILEAFDLFNALNITDRLSGHIHFESRQPQGTEYLYGLLHAIRNKLQVNFRYQKFVDDFPQDRTLEPYALKEAKYRWYVIGLDIQDRKMKSFSLDRMKSLDITRKNFRYPMKFDAESFYKNSFGIITPEKGSPSEVVLSFKPLQGKFIKTLPLHPSQEILVDNDRELRVKLSVYLTHDLLMEILSMGENVKVIKPVKLVRQVKSALQEALAAYE